jgi:peptide subunit release factor RF-3
MARKIFPCFFGSALKLDGVTEFLQGVEQFTEVPQYDSEFGARVFKITRDNQGNRLTHLKVTGGQLQVKDEFDEEKVNQKVNKSSIITPIHKDKIKIEAE